MTRVGSQRNRKKKCRLYSKSEGNIGHWALAATVGGTGARNVNSFRNVSASCILSYPVYTSCILSYPVYTSCILSYPVYTSCILSIQVASCLILSIQVVSCLILSIQVASCLILFIQVASCLILSIQVASCLILSIQVASCLILSIEVAPCLPRTRRTWRLSEPPAAVTSSNSPRSVTKFCLLASIHRPLTKSHCSSAMLHHTFPCPSNKQVVVGYCVLGHLQQISY